MALNPGHILLNGQYHILRLLGRGGFGFVYQARDALLGEDVAIKELIPALVGDEVLLKRFLAEARATMRLTHKRIVRTHNIFGEGGNYYIVMEYMPGGSLEERLRERGSLPPDEAVGVALDVCEGLTCAHEEGVVHCDLKPANILFAADGAAKVADFGIAHVSGEMLTRSWMTPAGFVAGTLPYMSPEQADGVRDDPRLDIYALGAVLYRMLTDRTYLEFDQRETPVAQADNVYRIRSQQPLPPSNHNPRVPSWLDAVVLKALAKRPEDRHVSAEALRTALQQQSAATQVATLSPSPPAESAEDRQTQHLPPPAPSGGAFLPKGRAPLPAWFWLTVGGAILLLALLLLGLGALLDGGQGEMAAGAGALPTAVAAPTRAATEPLPTNSPRPTTAASRTPAPPTQPPQPTPTATALTRQRDKDGMVMVYVPAGEFLMGSSAENSDNADERPQHTVYLDAFWIDQTEVTNAQFRQCVAAGVCQAPTDCYFRDPTFDDASKTDHPVVCVDWHGAETYCQWVGARLPTEAEWEKAARGTDGRVYPWGDSAADCDRAQLLWCDGKTVPAGSKAAGASPYGALDMVGNVWEWVNDWYDSGYYSVSPANNPPGPASGSEKVKRGSSWYDFVSHTHATDRDFNPPTSRFSDTGFRCASSPGE